MSWWKTAKVGDKVVCIEEQVRPGASGLPQALPGVVYTVKEVVPRPSSATGFFVNVGLVSTDGTAVGHCVLCFKPVDPSKRTTKAGMAILNDIRTRAEDYEVV